MCTECFPLDLRWEFPKASRSRLRWCRKVLDGIRTEAHEPNSQMVAGCQPRRHEAIHNNQIGIHILDDVDDGSKQINHLTSRVRHKDRSCITYCTQSVGEPKWLSKGLGEVAITLLASEVFLECLEHRDTIDLMVRNTFGECILEARGGGEMQIQVGICIDQGLGGCKKDVEFATLDVGEEQDSLGYEGSHGQVLTQSLRELVNGKKRRWNRRLGE